MSRRSSVFAIVLALLTLTVHGAPGNVTTSAKATFAGGCFWCMEPPFEGLSGVLSVVSGYTGGKSSNPSYDAVSGGGTGHVEAVEILYDPAKITYDQLLDVFWRNVDPTDGSGQFCDKGQQYLSVIFVHDAVQRRLALASREKRRARFPVMQTDVLDAGPFYRAEESHQDYYRKNPVRYRAYKFGCGRSARLRKIWGE